MHRRVNHLLAVVFARLMHSLSKNSLEEGTKPKRSGHFEDLAVYENA